ncbi:MAG: hypothetical protein KDC44_14675 [Phaeodactylibacter sp.]|nr:hypothetical protein [Phaeodactylibacter sp.]
MKARNFFALFLPMLFSSLVVVGQSAEKILVKSIPLGAFQEVQLDFKGAEVEVREWNNPYLRIQMTVALENGTDAVLKAFVRSGRYNIVAKPGEDFLQVLIPGINRKAVVGSEPAVENFKFVVYKPNLLKETTDEATAASAPIVLSALR